MISQRLREAPAEVQDVFAVARAALQATTVTGTLSTEGIEAVVAAFEARTEMGWDDEDYDEDFCWDGEVECE